MHLFSIAATTVDNVKEDLSESLSELSQSGLEIATREEHQGPFQMLFLDASVSPHSFHGEHESLFSYYVSRALADTILRRLEKGAVENLVTSLYPELPSEDRREICRMAREQLTMDGSGFESTCPLRRKRALQYYLTECIEERNHLNIEGFLRFRPRSYLEILRQAIVAAADTYLSIKEHEEFIQLLRYFVQLQRPRNQVVNVIVRPNGLFRLLDHQHEVVDNEYLEGHIYGILDPQVNNEDLLLSALITLSPVKIILHFDRRTELAETISQVFDHRVEFCRGCPLCENSRYYLTSDPPTHT